MFSKFLKFGGTLGVVTFGGYGYYHYTQKERRFHILNAEQPKITHGTIPTRTQQIEKLESNTEFDLLVIGGGATGTGIALDAATRGLNVALVERDDFASGTSSRSTNLVHGGVRYLEKAVWNLDKEQYNLVKEALHERYTFLQVAPHLTKEIPIMIPIYKWWQVPYFWIGTKCYDFLAGKRGLESSYYMSAKKALKQFPWMNAENLKGAMVYYDGQQNDARMCVSLALTAAQHGATIANHVEVIDLVKTKTQDGNEQVTGAVVKDLISGKKWTIKAKGVINATGPFSDTIRKMDNKDANNLIVPSSGVHIVLPNYYCNNEMGLLDAKTKDGRIIFFLPWLGNTVAGTTDTPSVVSQYPTPLEEEICFILDEISKYVNSKELQVRRGDVLAAYAGIRPLVRDFDPKNTKKSKKTEGLARTHVVEVSPNKLITIAGGKWTTYRRMAQDTVDKAVEVFNLKPKNSCVTENIKIYGAHDYKPTTYIKLIQQFGLDKEVALHLAETYGDKAFAVATLANPTGERWPVLGVPLSRVYPYIEAEVRYAARHEYACTAVDILARRTRLAFLNANAAMDALPRVVEILGEEFQWDENRKKKEMARGKKFLKTMGLIDVKSLSIFNAQDLVDYREIFGSMDTNRDGLVSKEELRAVIKKTREQVTDSEFEKFFEQIDTSKDNYIDFNEFVEFMGELKKNDADKMLKEYAKNLSDFNKKIPIHRSGGGL